MDEIKAPKKERKFLKAIGNIGKILAEELVMGIARKFIGKAIDKVGNKRQGLSIALIILASSFAFAQYPATGNKQRLGFQTTGDGLVWRGSLSDTAAIQPTTNQNAWLIIDTINFKIYSFDFTSNVWNALAGGTTIDTISLSNRINLKVNISDTAAMLLPYFRDADTSTLNLISRFALKLNISDTASMLANYATKAYADTSGRFYARQDFTNVTSSTLTWTQTDTLVVGGTGVVQVYRNGQILLPTQYTIPTKTTVVIGATAYKVGENYTVIFPRGGGGGGSGGSGSLTSISGGTGITVSPNPITTTGTVSADLSVLMELSDTVTLSNRINLKLNSADTASLSNRINTKGSGTVTSIGSGFGLLGGTITTTGTLRLDTSTLYTRIQDSINIAIGNDTIKILKQEYAPSVTNVLTWTVTPKFPIQLKGYILVFRNGQLLNNDQYNLTDTNKITIVSTSFKLGANYTVATVSGIGSVSSGQSNPIYPEQGIALSTGTTWTTSITNNSANWNTAYTDRLKWDGGSTEMVAATGRTSLGGTTVGQSMFTLTNPSAITFPQFNANNTVSPLNASSFRSAIGAGTGNGNGTVTSVMPSATSGNPLSISNIYTTPTIELLSATTTRNGYLTSTDWTTFNGKQNTLNGNGFVKASGTTITYDNSNYLNTSIASSTYQTILTNPITGTGVSGHIPKFTGTTTLDSSSIYSDNGKIGIGIDASTSSTHLTSKFVVRDNGNNFKFDGLATTSGYTTTFSHDNTGLKIGHSSGIRDIRFTLNGTSGLTIANNSNIPARAVGIGNDSPTHQLDVTGTFRATGAATLSSTLTVTGNITEGGNNVLTNLDTASLSSRIDGKVSLTGDQTIGGNKTFSAAITTSGLTLNSTISGTNRLLGLNSSGGAVGQITVGSGLNLTSDVLTATNPTEKYYFNLGIVAGAADNSNATYDFTYGSNVFIVPTSLNGYCIDSVYIRAVGCSTCPPVAGDKDYYVGVYKASAGNRITTSGATLVGSQITMNEYDLNEVNRNDTLSTGEAWWVYLNGTYTSDLAYITAGFIVKKTCN